MDEEFWVSSPQGRLYEKRSTLEAAKEQAEAIARRNPNQTYRVLRTVSWVEVIHSAAISQK